MYSSLESELTVAGRREKQIAPFVYQLYGLTNNEAALYFRVDIFLPLLCL